MNSVMETVCAICNQIQRKTASGVSFQKLLTFIRKEFRQQRIDLTIKTIRKKRLTEEEFYVNGYYDPESDHHNECPIELIIIHNFPTHIEWYPDHTRDFLIQIFDTVVHELRHQRQARKRKLRLHSMPGPENEEYLSDPDEIDAYSISIAIELTRTLGKTRALRYLHNPSTLSRFKINNKYVSPSLLMYKQEFQNPADPIIKELIKKIYIRLKKVDTDCIFV